MHTVSTVNMYIICTLETTYKSLSLRIKFQESESWLQHDAKLQLSMGSRVPTRKLEGINHEFVEEEGHMSPAFPAGEKSMTGTSIPLYNVICTPHGRKHRYIYIYIHCTVNVRRA